MEAVDRTHLLACYPGRRRAAAGAVAFAAILLGTVSDTGISLAQIVPYLTFQNQLRPKSTSPSLAKRPNDPNAQMLVQADEIKYDYNNEQVSAIGNVQIYYNGATIEADKVIYDQRTRRMHAEGNARLTEPDGKVTFGELIDLSDDYRDGFIDSLRVETVDETRMAAARGQRTGGNYTVLQSGVYTACEPCKDDPKKPPLWQIKAIRIIHNETEKMMYFEDAKVEFFGIPLAWFPYLSAPDPTVKRKSGFLIPGVSYSNNYGLGIETPYYFNLAPNYDATFTPRFTTEQGPLLRGEFRLRLDNGDVTFRASGIDQLDKSAFEINGQPEPGFREFRGAFETAGHFTLSPQWTWGWDGVVVTDPTFFSDYHIRQLQATSVDTLLSALTEGVNQLYLTGRGDRSYFDIRGINYYGYSGADVQSALPIVLPLIDYAYTFDQPVFGGELSSTMNITGIYRQTPSFDPISATAVDNNLCSTMVADTAQKTPANCLLRGVPGTYTRGSSQMNWRTEFIDPIFGQVFIPFVSVRGDAAAVHIDNDPGVANFINPGDATVLRAMPVIGLEYRYPFISVHGWGTETIEPIAQVIARPNETDIGKLPNEDSQSLIFDDTNLFKIDKFAGWDRVEGGGRANAGVQYTMQFNHGGNINALFGQSYQLFGINSFAIADTTNTGLGSGLDKQVSDYVARVSYEPTRFYNLTARFRFDDPTFAVQRFEFESKLTFDRFSASLMFGDYAAQPQLGFLTRREGLLPYGALKLSENWVVNAGVRYDFEASKLSQTRFGIGYIDDCFIMSLNYFTDFAYSAVSSNGTLVTTTNNSFMFQLSLRTLGENNSPGQNINR